MVRPSIAHSITAHNITGQYSTDYTNLYYTITVQPMISQANISAYILTRHIVNTSVKIGLDLPPLSP